MSDHEETTSDPGYDTPVPELDDHRLQSPSVSRQRRGTFDSLYRARHLAAEDPTVKARDFDQALTDDDAEVSPSGGRSRRPTADTIPDRDASPPNSVKAFAHLHRRERELSVSEQPRSERRAAEAEGLFRAHSNASRQSLRSRAQTPGNMTADNRSILTQQTAEEDVCFPLNEDFPKDKLHIDFDYLEHAMREIALSRVETESHHGREFPDLRQTTSATQPPSCHVTADGDFIDMPTSDTSAEKGKAQAPAEEPQKQAGTAAAIDKNRYSFFSSAWESTIHANDFADLVLPGEDLRGLFSFPASDTDGVWWLNVNNASQDETRAICKAFGVHPLTIEDITTQETREKIELFPAYYFACFRSFSIVEEEGGQDYEPFNIYAVVFREGTLSFSFAPNAHATNVRKRIAMLKDYVALSSDWICYAIM